MNIVSVQDDEKVLDMDGGNHCTTVWMHLINAWSVHLTMVKLVIFLQVFLCSLLKWKIYNFCNAKETFKLKEKWQARQKIWNSY